MPIAGNFLSNYFSFICIASVLCVHLHLKTEQELNNYKERNLTSPI